MKKNNNRVLILILIIAGVFGFFWVRENLVFNDSNDNGPVIQSKELTYNDFDISLDSGNWTSVYVSITPKRDINEIKLKVIYYDSDNAIIKTDYKTSYNLTRGQPYKLEFKNTFMETLKIEKWKVELVSGIRA